MRPRNLVLALLTVCTLVGIVAVYPKSQLLASLDVKKATAQQACQPLPAGTVSESDRNLARKELPLVEIAGYLAGVGQYDQALDLVKKMKYCDFRDWALPKVASGLAKRGQYDQAMKLADTINDDNKKVQVVDKIASSFAEVGQIDRALQAANTIKHGVSKAEALSRIAETLNHAGQHEEALRIANTITGNNVAISIKYQVIANIGARMAESGKIDRALQLANQLKFEDHPAKAFILRQIVRSLAEAGKYDQALTIADTITGNNEAKYYQKEAIGTIAVKLAESGKIDRASQVANRYGSSSNASLLGLSASALAEKGEFNRALEMIKNIKVDSARTTALANFTRTFSSTDTQQLEQVLQIAKQIKAEEPIARDDIFSNIAISFAKAGQVDRALQIASSIKSDSYLPEQTLRKISEILTKAGQYDQAKKVASTIQAKKLPSPTIKDATEKSMAFVDIAASLAETGKIADAVQLISTIEDDASVPNKFLYATVMVLAKAKKYNQALQMANYIQDENHKAWTLAQLANQLTEAGQPQLAAQVIKPALEIVGLN